MRLRTTATVVHSAQFKASVIFHESVALPATLEISDTPARSGVVSRAAARLRIELIPELGGPSFTRVAPRAPSPTPERVEAILLYTRQPAIAEPRESHSLRIRSRTPGNSRQPSPHYAVVPEKLLLE